MSTIFKRGLAIGAATMVGVLLTTGAAAQMPPELAPYIPTSIKPYFVGFLMGEPKEQPSMELLQAHLGYIRAQTEAGKYLLAGPFLDGGSMQGMLVINAATIDEARAIVSADPMVKAGRLTIEVHPAMMTDLSGLKTVYAPKP